MSDLEARIAALEDKEAIRELKHRYFRCLDTNDMEGMAQLFTEDATSWYTDGKWSFDSRDGIIGFLSGNRRLSLHTAHQPEITLTSATTATGIWRLEDWVFRADGRVLHGSGYYRDEYVKIDGEWKIKRTGYDRGFEHVETLAGSLVKGPKAWIMPGSHPAERPPTEPGLER